MNIAQVRALIRPLRRALHWEAPVAFAVGAVALVALVGYGLSEVDELVFNAARRAAVFLAAGAAFFVLDPAAVTVASVPPPIVCRRALSLAVGWTGIAAAWGVVLGIAELRADMPIPSADITVELAALTLIATAIGYAAERAGASGGIAGCIGLFAASIALPAIPSRYTLVGGWPGDAVWAAAHGRWVVVLAVGTCVVLAFSRDPARSVNRFRARARQR